jgi:hypothetical protein
VTKRLLATVAVIAAVLSTGAWGVRGHQTANRAAVDAIPADGPVFLREFREWIAVTGPLPDSWRGTSEPYSKIFEDPNHGWFKEQFAFMKEIPRNRYEFVIRLYDQYLKLKDTDKENATFTNVRWTGTLPYAAMENYDRMKSAMRLYRAAPEGSIERRYLAQDIAFYMGWLGHYTADGAQPLHDTIHHDGWVGPNPKDYTRDPRIHGRFESQFVDLIEIKESDLGPSLTASKVLPDPFAAIVAHLDDAYDHVEDVYMMEKRGAFAQKDDKQARDLVIRQLARAGSLLRDLAYTAWTESGKPMQRGGNANSAAVITNPISPKNPAYNPETGTAPPQGPAVANHK